MLYGLFDFASNKYTNERTKTIDILLEADIKITFFFLVLSLHKKLEKKFLF